MDYTEKLLTAVVNIGFLVGTFLLITNRYRKAIDLLRECLVLLNNNVVIMGELYYLRIYISLARACHIAGDPRPAIEYGEKAREISIKIGYRRGEEVHYSNLGDLYQCLGEYVKAREFHEKALAICIEIGDRSEEGACCSNLGEVFQFLGEYDKASEFYKKALAISIEIGNRHGEGVCYCNLGTVHEFLGEYVLAREFLEKSLAISIEIGDRRGEEVNHSKLGDLYLSLGEYVKARESHEKALPICIEISDRSEEGTCCSNLGNVYKFLGEYDKASEFHEKALAISKEIGNRHGEGACYYNLGTVHESLGEYVMARKCYEKAIAISKETADRWREEEIYGNLGNVYHFLGAFTEARELHKKALTISIEIGDRRGEGAHNGNLGKVYESLGEYMKAREFHEKALAISILIGDRQGEGAHYGNLGNLYPYLGEYVTGREFLERSLAISIEIGDRRGEGICYSNLGTVCKSLGEYSTARELYGKALEISIPFRDRNGEGAIYGKLGDLYQSLDDYAKAREFHEKALAIFIEIGDRRGEETQYCSLGKVFEFLGEYAKAREFFEKTIAVCLEIGDRCGEAECYSNLGTVYSSLGFDGLAEKTLKKGLAIAVQIGTVATEYNCYCRLAILYVSKMKMKEAHACLSTAVEGFEDLRGFLGEHDQYKINFADRNSFPYHLLALMLCRKQETIQALLVLELGRARALADLMSAQYSFKGISNRLALADIEQTMRKEKSTCTGLYISFFFEIMLLWIIKANKKVLFQEIDKDDIAALPNCRESLLQDCIESLASQSYRNLTVIQEGECEDRSLFTFYESEAKCQPQAEEKPASCRLVEENEEENEQEQEPALRSLYKVLISPVADLLEGSEIIICPPPSLYQVPFPALMDEDERYLSEKFRIRLIPSLTSLKQIQDSPADYHSQTGALIVGDPDVGRTEFSPLPCAREEAKIIGILLHVQPLIGPEATKQAVLHSMRSVSLIHIAAHGDAKRGEIALAPLRPMHRTPQKADFMLTMSDISEVQLRAKLVVLSCCHSGRGEIRAEGVIGIARAFLGSGARSVLVSLWAVDDRATKEFMREFYQHLSWGESASECLHEAMKWMRGHPEYCAVRQWAPFVLIGDNVTFNFEELTRDQRSNST